MKPPKSIAQRRAEINRQQLQAARFILEDVEMWGGEEAALVKWARAVVERLG